MKNSFLHVSSIVEKRNTSPILIVALLLTTLLLAACGSYGATTTGSARTQGTQATSHTTGATGATTSSHDVTTLASSQQPSTTSAPSGTAVPLTSIRMLNSQNGWAITGSAIVKTTDGGLHWHNVGPSRTQIKNARGEFFSTQVAWVVAQEANSANPNTIEVLRTLDGGQHWQTWQSSVLSTDNQHEIIGSPDFVNMQDGWVELSSNGGPGAGSEAVEIYRTTDGGQVWSKVSATTNEQPNGGLPLGGIKTGFSFKDTLNGWATATYYAENNAWLYATHDGGKTWQQQSLPLYPGLSSAEYDTLPPVFLGNTGILPVNVNVPPHSGLVLYITHNGGQTWMTTSLAPFMSQNAYAFDMNHTWATNQNGVFYRTLDGGANWQQEQAIGQFISALSFVSTNEGWAIGTPGGKALLLHTTDGGKTWQRINYSVQ